MQVETRIAVINKCAAICSDKPFSCQLFRSSIITKMLRGITVQFSSTIC